MQNWKLQPFALLECFQTMWNYLKQTTTTKQKQTATKQKQNIMLEGILFKTKHGYPQGLTVRFFIDVYTFGFWALWYDIKIKLNWNVLIFSFTLFVWSCIIQLAFKPTEYSQSCHLPQASGEPSKPPSAQVSPYKADHRSLPPPGLRGESCSLNCLFAPCLTTGRITFLGHSFVVLSDLIFLWWPGPCHPNMRRNCKLKSDTYWNETLILRRNSDLFSLTLELELNL